MKKHLILVVALFLFTLPARIFAERRGFSKVTMRDATPEELEKYEAAKNKRQAFLNMDPYALEAVALDTNASYCNRIDALETLTNNPVAHVDALKSLVNDPRPRLRLIAIEIIDLVEPDFAWKAAKQLLSEAPQISTNRMGYSYVLNTIGFLARKGDGSGLPLLVEYLLGSSGYSEVSSAISRFSTFRYLKELKPYKPLVDFIDQTLPRLASQDKEIRDDSITLLKRACYKLNGLHAVETIPDFKRWLESPLPEPVQDAMETNLRWLKKTQARLDAGEPDMRDSIKKNPSTDPAWKPHKRSFRY